MVKIDDLPGLRSAGQTFFNHAAWLDSLLTPSGSRESLSRAKRCTGPQVKS